MKAYVESRIVAYANPTQDGEHPPANVFATAGTSFELPDRPDLKLIGGIIDVINENAMMLYREFVECTNKLPLVAEGQQIIDVDRNGLYALLNGVDGGTLKLLRSFAVRNPEEKGKVWYCLQFEKP